MMMMMIVCSGTEVKERLLCLIIARTNKIGGICTLQVKHFMYW